MGYSKICTGWFQKQLTNVREYDRDVFLNLSATGVETWVQNYEPVIKKHTMQWKFSSSPVTKMS